MNQCWSAYLFVFGGHHSHVWQRTTLLMVLLSNIMFFSCSFLTVEDLSRRRKVDVPDSDPILWSWFKPIPWSCSSIISLVSSKPPTSSNVFHLPSASSFVSFSFFFEYFSKSSLIFNWSGWWLFRTYKSCFETEHRSRFGSSYVQRLYFVWFRNVFGDTSTVEAFRRMRFRRATKFFLILNIWDSCLIVLLWASFESSGIMFILVWILHHLQKIFLKKKRILYKKVEPDVDWMQSD